MELKKYSRTQQLVKNTYSPLQLPSIQSIKTMGIPLLENKLGIRQSEEPLDKKINEIQGNIKLLERKYKNNLKNGFDHKIKAYRLQAVVQRKILQEKLEDAAKSIQFQARLMKYQQAKKQRERQQQFSKQLKNIKQVRASRIKSRWLNQKQQRDLSLRDNLQKMQQWNRQAHDKIIQDHQLNSKKKIYFDQLKKSLVKKQTNYQKQQQLQKILYKIKKFDTLKQQLKQINQYQIKQQSFLTI